MLYKIGKLKERVISLQEANNKVVFTNGCFDILHPGHFQYLKQSKDLGDFLIVGINSDSSVKKLKGTSRPINKEQVRSQNLIKLDYVDAVIIFNEDTPIQLIKSLKPNILTKGGDYQESDIVGSKFVEKNGGQVKILPLLKGYSTTNIIQGKGKRLDCGLKVRLISPPKSLYLFMKQGFRQFNIFLIFIASIALSQESNGNGSAFTESPLRESRSSNSASNENRLPDLLREAKILLSDAFISDVMNDTLEVVYNLNRIFDLLSEADQYGEMDDEDREEFDRFEESLVSLYSKKFSTLDKVDASLTAENMRMDVTSLTEPLEVEMGATQFVVIEDRDGHIPLVRNKKVDQFIEYFKTKGRPQFEIWLDRLEVYGPMLSKIIDENNLPPELLYLAMIESGLNPKAHSKAAATGMWQFVYSTGKIYGLKRNWYVDERRDPEKSTRAAMAYLSTLYKEFDNWYLALAAYNSGENRVRRATKLHQTTDFWQLHSLPRETRNYMPYFLSATIIAKNPQDYGFSRKKKSKKPYKYDLVTIEKSADLTVLAKAAGTSYKNLQSLNPLSFDNQQRPLSLTL